MSTPNVLILRAPGTNCDHETAFAFERAGGRATVLHINRLLEQPTLFDQFQILCIPGGFSYGDDLGAGRIFGVQMQHNLADALEKFKADGKLILGICNGFQVLMKTHLLVDADGEKVPEAALTSNDSGKYEDRWVRLGTDGAKCVFLKGIESMYLPVAHAEGKFVARDQATLDRLNQSGRLVLRYLPQRHEDKETRRQGDKETRRAGEGETRRQISRVPSPDPRVPSPFPDNPNGSMADVAGICDGTGRVLGLMPHPERHIDPTQHPRWTRGEAGPVGDGLQIFQNAVRYFA